MGTFRGTPGGRALLAGAVVVALLAACTSDDDDTSATDTSPSAEAESSEPAATEPSDTEPVDTEPADTEPPATEPADTEAPAPSTTEAPAITEDRAYYILPPGNYGGLPTNDNSLDQLPLYDALTPLRGDISDDDLDAYFLPQDFEPIGQTTAEDTGRPGTTVVYDEYGIAHVTGETREDLAFGAGWVTARDRGLLLQFGAGAARVAVADVPGIDAFSLVTDARPFVPSAQAEQLVTDQVQLIRETYGDEGEEIVAEAQAYADGVNAFRSANGQPGAPFTVNDVVATTALIGSIFGAGGGREVRNAEFLASLQSRLGDELGAQVWNDFMQWDDPESPTTLDVRFEYPALTGGEVTGSVVLDEGSVIDLDPLAPAPGSSPQVEGLRIDGAAFTYDATDGPVERLASNWLLVEPDASANGTTLAVQGPQLGYYYPEIVQQIHLSGPGVEAQGAAVPGLAMYMLIGRTQDYSWSLTSASQDVRDVFAEVLCEPDGSAPTRESGSYEFDGECVPFEVFDAGTLDGAPIRYPVSVHGPVIGTATVDGAPVALTSKRSTFGRDGLNLGALKNMTEGDAATPEEFFESANRFGFTFNWGYANRDGIAYFASGELPVRAEGLDRRLPTLGTGDYEWQGFLELDEHPHADAGPDGRLLNWNNQSAPGFMHGDGTQYGSVHRVENFDQWPDEIALTDVVAVMNRAATEDEMASLWPVVSAVLAEGEAPSELAAEVVAALDEWAADDAPWLDADEDGFVDDAPGPLIYDDLVDAVATAVMEPVLAPVLADDVPIRGISQASFIDKDLRTVLGEDVEGEFEVSYCGAGDLAACTESLWAAVEEIATRYAAEQGDDVSTWLREGLLIGFQPGLIPEQFRATNRPTYQQVREFAPSPG